MFIIFHVHFNTDEQRDIIEFSGIKLNTKFETIDRTNVTIQPKSPLSEKAKHLTNISDATLDKSFSQTEGIKFIHNWIADAKVLITWSKATGFGLINKFNDIELIQNVNLFDLSSFVRKRMNKRNVPSLTEALHYFQLDNIGIEGMSEYRSENYTNIFIHLAPSEEELSNHIDNLNEYRMNRMSPSTSKVPSKRKEIRKWIKPKITSSLKSNVEPTWHTIENSVAYKNVLLLLNEEQEFVKNHIKVIFNEILSSEWYFSQKEKWFKKN